MLNMKKMIIGVSAAILSSTAMAQNAPQLRADNIDEIVAAMTLEEKAQLLVGGGNDGFIGSGAMLGHQKKLVAGAAGTTVAIERLGIPATVVADGPAGVHIDAHRDGTDQTFFATGFPIGTCLASTWNTELVKEVGKAIGNETLEYGCDVILGPALNLHRSPLCGRNFEYYSEDPILSGKIGAAVTLGIQSQGVGVSAKHFAVNSQESDRTIVDERLSARALRELYLKGFEILVKESKPWTIMSSYNRINVATAREADELRMDVIEKLSQVRAQAILSILESRREEAYYIQNDGTLSVGYEFKLSLGIVSVGSQLSRIFGPLLANLGIECCFCYSICLRQVCVAL